MSSRFASAACLLALGGCASTLSTMDTARTVPVGHVRLDGAAGFYANLGPVADVGRVGIDVARDLRAGKRQLTAEELNTLYEAGLSLALLPPQPVYEAMIRTGVAANADVGFRLATSSLRLDAKYRYLHRGTEETEEWNASVGAGFAKVFLGNAVLDVLEYVKIDDFSRYDVEVPLLVSFEAKQQFAAYAGLKYVYSRVSLDEQLLEIAEQAEALGVPRLLDDVKINMHFGGALVGLKAGYQNVWAVAELTVGYTYLRPRLYSVFSDDLKERNAGGLTIYPALGLVLEVP